MEEQSNKTKDWLRLITTEDGRIIAWLYFIKYIRAEEVYEKLKKDYLHIVKETYRNKILKNNKVKIPSLGYIRNCELNWKKLHFLKAAKFEIKEQSTKYNPLGKTRSYTFNLNPLWAFLDKKYPSISFTQQEKKVFESWFSEPKVRVGLFNFFVNKPVSAHYLSLENRPNIKLNFISTIMKVTEDFLINNLDDKLLYRDYNKNIFDDNSLFTILVDKYYESNKQIRGRIITKMSNILYPEALKK